MSLELALLFDTQINDILHRGYYRLRHTVGAVVTLISATPRQPTRAKPDEWPRLERQGRDLKNLQIGLEGRNERRMRREQSQKYRNCGQLRPKVVSASTAQPAAGQPAHAPSELKQLAPRISEAQQVVVNESRQARLSKDAAPDSRTAAGIYQVY